MSNRHERRAAIARMGANEYVKFLERENADMRENAQAQGMLLEVAKRNGFLPHITDDRVPDGQILITRTYTELDIQEAVRQERERAVAIFRKHFALYGDLNRTYEDFDRLMRELRLIAMFAHGRGLIEALEGADEILASTYVAWRRASIAFSLDIEESYPLLPEIVDALIRAIPLAGKQGGQLIVDIIERYRPQAESIRRQLAEHRGGATLQSWRHLLGGMIYSALAQTPKPAYWRIAKQIEAELSQRDDLTEDESIILNELRTRFVRVDDREQSQWKQRIKQWFNKVLTDYRERSH